MAVFIGATGRAKYFVYFGSKKIYSFGTLREAKSYVQDMVRYGYPYLAIKIKHKGEIVG